MAHLHFCLPSVPVARSLKYLPGLLLRFLPFSNAASPNFRIIQLVSCCCCGGRVGCRDYSLKGYRKKTSESSQASATSRSEPPTPGWKSLSDTAGKAVGGLRCLEKGIRCVLSSEQRSAETNTASTGDIIYMEALGQPILVLNSSEDCINLMEKRAVNYSDRAEIPAVEMSVFTFFLKSCA